MNNQARIVGTSKHPDVQPVFKTRRTWPLVGFSLVACFLVGLFYLLQLTPSIPAPLGIPKHQQKDELVARPQIELHPELHIHRGPVTQYLNWRVSSDYRRPDGVLKRVCLINGGSQKSRLSIGNLTEAS